MCTKPARQRGLTLIELIIFIIIVSVALAGSLAVFNMVVRGSADPSVRKQMLAVAEAILEEVQLQPFTWCDPDDANAAEANAYGDCATASLAQNLASAKTGETRGNNVTPLDNVLDYNGETVITTNIAGGGGTTFTASVAVAPAALNGIGGDAALLITVTVAAAGESLQLQGYRARHSPRALP